MKKGDRVEWIGVGGFTRGRIKGTVKHAFSSTPPTVMVLWDHGGDLLEHTPVDLQHLNVLDLIVEAIDE